MKKIITLFVFSFFIVFNLRSQITIVQGDMPNAGDTLRVSYSASSLDPWDTDSSCNAYLWDYSQLVPNAQWVRKFDSPSTFVFPFNILFNPANTSYGESQYTPDSIPFLGIKPGDSYNFYRETSIRFRQVGTGFSINSIPLPFAYNPHDTIYRFPLNCGDRDTSYAKFGLSIPGIGYYGQSINRINFSDGEGTLITPFGTFTALRIRSAVSVRDTFADTTGNGGFAFTRPLVYEFKWLVKGGKVPYLQVNANVVGSATVVNQISYRDSMRNVIQIGVNNIDFSPLSASVYPNPSSGIVFVSYALIKSETVMLELFDVTGRTVNSWERKQSAGDHVEIINLAEKNSASGIYFLKIKAGQKEGNFKLIFNKS